MNDLKVGQTVFIKGLNNRHGAGVAEATITKVGKKYFEVDPTWYGRFYIDTLLHDAKRYSPQHKVYLDLNKLEEEKEAAELSTKIRHSIGQYGTVRFPIETLRRLWEILNTTP